MNIVGDVMALSSKMYCRAGDDAGEVDVPD